VPGQFNNWSTTATGLTQELTNGVGSGVWSADVTAALVGQEYKYYINYSGGSVWRHDPCARKVVSSSTGPGGNDIVYDPSAFNWAGDSLTPPGLEDLVIYELHIGTFYDPNPSGSGHFTDAINRLDYLQGLGVSAVELMPIAEFPGSNSWGYNPSEPYAANNNAYGGPDGLKAFVKACHARGIAVFLDVVHNHYGPTDLDLWNFDGWTGGGSQGGIYFYQDSPLCCTPYGSRPNYSRQPVRDYISQNFQMWLDEYHVDGFRWDTPGLMMNADSTYIPEAASLISAINEMMLTNYPGKINIAEDRLGYGFDGAWDLSLLHYITPQLVASLPDANRDIGAITYALTNNTTFNIPAGLNRVVYLESHDSTGDLNNGTRLATAIDSSNPASYLARKLSTLGATLVFTAPGVPMIFQGQEMLDNLQFSSSRPVNWSKTNTYGGIVQLYGDLIRLRRNLDGYAPGLKGDQCTVYRADDASKLVAYRRWKTATSNDVVVVGNFAGVSRTNYTLQFPRAGKWYVHFNSDSTTYGSDYGNIGSETVTASGTPAVGNLTVGPYSALILSQVPPQPQLTVTESNGIASVSWPSAFATWMLETTATPFENPPSWSEVPADEYQTNATSVYIHPPLSGGPGYYRLRKP